MQHTLARSIGAGLAMAFVGATSASALDPGNYTVQCVSPDRGNGATYDISMDKIDLLTLKTTFGAVISGVRLDDGKRIMLIGDRNCALIETARRTR
jgi:hypothetical protein